MARRALYRAALGAAITTNSNNTIKAGQNDEMGWQGGNGFFYAVGTWNGATAKLQALAPDGSTWVDVGLPVTFSADGMGAFNAPAGELRANVAGVAAGTSLKCFVVGVPTNNAG